MGNNNVDINYNFNLFIICNNNVRIGKNTLKRHFDDCMRGIGWLLPALALTSKNV